MTRQNNQKIQTSGGPSCSKIPKATECTDKRKTKAFPYDERYNIYKSLTPVAIADATPVNYLEMAVRIGPNGEPHKGGKRRKTRKNKKKLGRKTRSKRQKGSGVNCSRPEQCTTDQNMEEEDPNTIDEYLEVAIEAEDAKNVKKYLDEDANPNVMITDRHLHLPVNVRPPPVEVPAIIYAARHITKSSEIMKHLIDKDESVKLNANGTTPLIEAVEYGNQLAVKYLLGIGVDINATTHTGVTAIGYAILNEDIPMIKLMLEERKGEIDLNYTLFGVERVNVIDEAIENNANPEVIQILKEYANEIKHEKLRVSRFVTEKGNNKYGKPLLTSTRRDAATMISKYLGGDDALTNFDDFKKALLRLTEVAPAEEEDYKLVKYLIDKAVENDDEIDMKELMNVKNEENKPPLMLITEDAVDDEDEYAYKIVELLVEHGANISAKYEGYTALSSSNKIQKLLILKLMRQNDNYYKETKSHLAEDKPITDHSLITGHFPDSTLTIYTNDNDRFRDFKEDLRKRLKEYVEEAYNTIASEIDRKNLEDIHTKVVSNVKERNEVKKENPNIVEQEIEQCANQCRETIKTKYKQKPYEKVLGNPDLKREIAKNFGGKKGRNTRKHHHKKKHGIKTRSKRQRGGVINNNIKLIRSSMYGNRDAVAKLLKEGADVNAKNSDGYTALILASSNGRTEIVAMLLDAGANVNARTNTNYWGSTALIRASENKHTEIVSMLLDNGADVNATDNDGDTALMRVINCDEEDDRPWYQVESDIIEIVEMLLTAGADVNVVNDSRKTALDIAEETGCTKQIKKIIIKHIHPPLVFLNLHPLGLEYILQFHLLMYVLLLDHTFQIYTRNLLLLDMFVLLLHAVA